MILLIFSFLLFFPQNPPWNLDKKGLALEGYDPVSYFAQSPVKGTENFQWRVGNATYLFASAENRDRFRAAPEKYLGMYGGWCAYAMGLNGELVGVDPLTYKVVEGRLYLFYHSRGTNTLTLWNTNEKSLLPKANAHWQALH